jgi:hypothetical protein
MLIIAKIALGFGATLAVGGVYLFHEGVINIDVDELRPGGSHVHVWVPATAVSLGLRVVPRHHMEHAASQVQPFLPVLREVAKELKRLPNAKLIEAKDGTDHVFIGTVDGKIRIDAVSNEETVHVRIPIETVEDLADRLEADAPTI